MSLSKLTPDQKRDRIRKQNRAASNKYYRNKCEAINEKRAEKYKLEHPTKKRAVQQCLTREQNAAEQKVIRDKKVKPLPIQLMHLSPNEFIKVVNGMLA